MFSRENQRRCDAREDGEQRVPPSSQFYISGRRIDRDQGVP